MEAKKDLVSLCSYVNRDNDLTFATSIGVHELRYVDSIDEVMRGSYDSMMVTMFRTSSKVSLYTESTQITAMVRVLRRSVAGTLFMAYAWPPTSERSLVGNQYTTCTPDAWNPQRSKTD